MLRRRRLINAESDPDVATASVAATVVGLCSHFVCMRAAVWTTATKSLVVVLALRQVNEGVSPTTDFRVYPLTQMNAN